MKVGGKKKDCFTVQFFIMKNSDELIPFIILLGDPNSWWNGDCIYIISNQLLNTFLWLLTNLIPRLQVKCVVIPPLLLLKIRESKPDNNWYPNPKSEQCYITVAKTANSNKTLTKIISRKVILPCVGAGVPSDDIDHLVGVLWDNFKAHSCPEVKRFCQSQDNLDVDIFPVWLKPVGQPLYNAINKVFKGFSMFCMISTYLWFNLFLPVTQNRPPDSFSQLGLWRIGTWFRRNL